jgi:hypothetical protein
MEHDLAKARRTQRNPDDILLLQRINSDVSFFATFAPLRENITNPLSHWQNRELRDKFS